MLSVVVIELAEVRRLAESKEEENLLFRRYLRAHHHPIEPFRILASKIEQQTDCTKCANCCQEAVVSVTAADIERIADHLDMPVEDVLHLYTEVDPSNSSVRILINRNNRCTFLDENLCMIYEARPRVCRDFPHVAPDTHTLGSRFSSICRNARYCPILCEAIEEYKHVVGFNPPAAQRH